MILENLNNIKEDILDITEDMLYDKDESSDPMMVSWSYEENPELMYTLIISETLPDEIDYLTSEVIH